MENKWQCKFKNPPEQITVGQKLLMICEGDKAVKFKNPVYIKLPTKNQAYSLYVLKTLNKEDYFLALEVTSYRTGDFKSPFTITDGEQNLNIENLSFSVQSVLNNTTQVQAQAPFGPFKPPLPLWYLSTMIFTICCLSACVLIFLIRFFKRKKFIQKVLNRKSYLTPSKSFIVSLRQQKEETSYSIKNLEKLFKIFLEDLFFIPVIDKTNKQIMKNFKRYQAKVYKKESQNLRQILNEFSSLNNKNTDQQSFLKLKKVCQNTAFLLDNKKEKTNELA